LPRSSKPEYERLHPSVKGAAREKLRRCSDLRIGIGRLVTKDQSSTVRGAKEYPEGGRAMANKASTVIRAAGSAVTRELDRLRKEVKDLTLRLEREIKARKLDVRLAAEGKKAREQLTKQIKALREQGRKLASELKSTLGDAAKRKRALNEARSKITDLRAQLARQTGELKRKSEELRKLATESAHRAAEIMRGDGQPATEPAPTEPTAPPEHSEPGVKNSSTDEPNQI